MHMKRQFLIIVLLLAGILSVDLKPVSLSDPENTRIHVSIKGAVEKEETISLKQYATVQEAIDQIRLKENADISSLNPNMVLKDADVLSIPYQTDEEESYAPDRKGYDLSEIYQLRDYVQGDPIR